jgi:hypothetical protein
MPKPKFQRADAFDQSKPTIPAADVPYINAGAMNSAVYENGASSFPMSGFEDPVEKENQVLKGQLAELMQQLEGRTSDLAVHDGTLLVHGFQFSRTGLIAPEAFSEEVWEQVGNLLFRLEGSIQWLIGDWLAYGANLRYGDIRKLAQALGRDENTLTNYKLVCQSVEFPRRRGNLSFGHHEAIYTLDSEDQETALAYAEDSGLSVAKFRKWLREWQLGKKGYDRTSLLPPYGPAEAPASAWKGLIKLSQRDPFTYKPREKEELLEYAQQLRDWIDDLISKANHDA